MEMGAARVDLTTLPEMGVDEAGLLHGGFVFGLADHAAMLAVNHPNVVLGAAEVRFLMPVRVGETLRAEARLEPNEGTARKQRVRVSVFRTDEEVFHGVFTCFVLERHVLAPRGSASQGGSRP
ncbi:MAG TPA: hotdog domain-containing protein [Thermoanaerobaculia bacterium]|nr:hotdog domain-containing protein [Thermoanaerobaculia bacterium]